MENDKISLNGQTAEGEGCVFVASDDDVSTTKSGKLQKQATAFIPDPVDLFKALTGITLTDKIHDDIGITVDEIHDDIGITVPDCGDNMPWGLDSNTFKADIFDKAPSVVDPLFVARPPIHVVDGSMSRGEFNHAQIQRLIDDSDVENVGDLSDGYHTFDELYEHRAALFSALCNAVQAIRIIVRDVDDGVFSSALINKYRSLQPWKSRQHHDVNFPMFDGMFIVGMQTPFGQITYHYDNELWDSFAVEELERAPEFDGHTPADVVNRLKLLSGLLQVSVD